jgi:hypothetical protein
MYVMELLKCTLFIRKGVENNNGSVDEVATSVSDKRVLTSTTQNLKQVY